MIENSYNIFLGHKRTILINAPLNVLHFSMLTCHGCQQLTGNSAALPLPRCHTLAATDSTHYGPLTTMTNLGKRNELHSQCGHRAASTPTPTPTKTQMELPQQLLWQLHLGWTQRAPLAIQSAFRSFAACLRSAVLCLRNS